MNQHSSLSGSLLERAAQLYDFEALIGPSPARPDARASNEPRAGVPEAPIVAPAPVIVERPRPSGRKGAIDRDGLAAAGFIRPDAAVTGLAEEFRIVKRQLLQGRATVSCERRHTILVASAHPGEGKTFCAINLALSLASEKDNEVLLVDGDFGKPEILATLGIAGGPGFIDAIADPHANPEAFVIRTDVPGLSVLPAGRQANNVTELIASGRTAAVLEQLGRNRPDRIILFDSPPALMASPAAVLAGHVGQLLMVVRADCTTEADLREALGLLSACADVRLLLNAAALTVSGRRFGGYYGHGA